MHLASCHSTVIPSFFFLSRESLIIQMTVQFSLPPEQHRRTRKMRVSCVYLFISRLGVRAMNVLFLYICYVCEERNCVFIAINLFQLTCECTNVEEF